MRITLMLFCTIVAFISFGGIMKLGREKPQEPSNRSSVLSDFARAVKRIIELRGSGAHTDGIHVLYQPIKISEDDYLLMGCDNAVTRRNHPDVNYEDLYDWRWFAGGPDLQNHGFTNCHSVQRRDGTWEIEAYYSNTPKAQYQASAEEAAWHYVRVRQLRKDSVPQEERIRMMTAEAQSQPWLTMR